MDFYILCCIVSIANIIPVSSFTQRENEEPLTEFKRISKMINRGEKNKLVARQWYSTYMTINIHGDQSVLPPFHNVCLRRMSWEQRHELGYFSLFLSK